MGRLYNSFEMVGGIFIPSEERFYKVNETASGYEFHSLNFAVQENNNNSLFVEINGGLSRSYTNVVKTFGKGTENEKGTKIEIPWEDRLKEESVDLVADFRKTIVDFTTDLAIKEKASKLRQKKRGLEYQDELSENDKKELLAIKQELKELDKDRHEFITTYDAVQFLYKNLPLHSKKKFLIKGQFDFSESKGRFYRRCRVEHIEVVSDDTPNKMKAQFDIFYTQDSLDDVDFEETKKLIINGYVLSRDSRHQKDVFFPSQFVINANKLDFANETHVRRLNALKKRFEVEDGVYHLPWEVNLFRGANEVEFSIDHLTDDQREAIELGFNTLEDFKPRSGIKGTNLEESRLVKPLLQRFDDVNNFVNGAKLTTYEVKDLKYVPFARQEQPVKKTETKEKEELQFDDLDDLFS